MGNTELIKIINSELGRHKYDFLNEVQSRIYNYIDSKSCAQCLSIVERKSFSITWHPSDSLDGYIPRFIAFIRKKRYKGNELDSALTDEVVNIVVTTYNRFIQTQSGYIIKPIIEDALNNRIIINSIAKKAVDTWQSYIPQYLKQKLMAELVHRIEDSINTNIVHASSQAVSTTATKIIAGVAAGATAIPISKSMAALLAKHMAILLKGIVAKILASAAFKTMIATLVKKFVAFKILSVIISSIGAKLAGISIGYILAPLILAFIAYEAYTLPRKMAKDISASVVDELSKEFANMNNQISINIVAELGTSAITAYISDIVNDNAMKEFIDTIKKELT